MKTILIFVSSLDGKVTRWDEPEVRTWSSKSDQKYFDKIWHDTRIIIMGSGTYFVDPVKPVRNHLFIVVTRTPARFNDRSNPGMLEFTDEEPSELIKRFEKEEKVLIVGGPQIATLFLKENLVDELWLTFEPKIFGTGKNFATGYKLDITLELISCEKSNPQGTLITKYRVV